MSQKQLPYIVLATSLVLFALVWGLLVSSLDPASLPEVITPGSNISSAPTAEETPEAVVPPSVTPDATEVDQDQSQGAGTPVQGQAPPSATTITPTCTPTWTPSKTPTITPSFTRTHTPTPTYTPTSTPTATPTYTPTPIEIPLEIVWRRGALVRTGAGEGYAEIGGLSTGDLTTAVGRAEDSAGRIWLQIRFNGEFGWISGVTAKPQSGADDIMTLPEVNP